MTSDAQLRGQIVGVSGARVRRRACRSRQGRSAPLVRRAPNRRLPSQHGRCRRRESHGPGACADRQSSTMPFQGRLPSARLQSVSAMLTVDRINVGNVGTQFFARMAQFVVRLIAIPRGRKGWACESRLDRGDRKAPQPMTQYLVAQPPPRIRRGGCARTSLGLSSSHSRTADP